MGAETNKDELQVLILSLRDLLTDWAGLWPSESVRKTIDGIRLDLVEASIEKRIQEKLDSNAFVPELWRDLETEIRKRKNDSDKLLKQKVFLFQRTLPVFGDRFESLGKRTATLLFDVCQDVLLRILLRSEQKASVFEFLLNCFSTSVQARPLINDPIVQQKIKIVEVLLRRGALSQAELRRALGISTKDRANFKKTHIVPLVESSVLEEERVPLHNRAYYKLTQIFLDSIRSRSQSSTSVSLQDELKSFSDSSPLVKKRTKSFDVRAAVREF